MPDTTVKIPTRLHAALLELARVEGRSLVSVLEKAVDEYRRVRFLEGLNADYAKVRADPKAWADLVEERELWDSTLADGLSGTDASRVREGATARPRKPRKRK